MSARRSGRSPLWKPPVDQEVSEEFRFHLEMRTREYIDQGLDPDEARARALARFGDPDEHGSQCRSLARERDRALSLRTLLEELRIDLRFGFRQLVEKPAFFLVLIVVLSLGLASAIGVFGLVHDALLAPPGFEEPDRLVTLWETQPQRGATKNVVGPANFLPWRERNSSFSRIAGFASISANLTGDDRPQRVVRRLVTDGYFEVLGVAPAHGRTLGTEDAVEGAEPVVVLSHGLWMDRYGADPAILGRPILVDGTATTVVGVMPEGFQLDMGTALYPLGAPADLWAPLPVSGAWRTAGGRWLQVIGRLEGDASIESANRELAAIHADLEEENPDLNSNWSAQVVALQSHLTDAARLPLWTLFGTVLLILLLVGVNSASLLVSRSVSRSREMAVRSALGAGRARLFRQMLVEAGLIAFLAAGLGLALAWTFLRIAPRLLPPELGVEGPITLSPAVVSFAVLVILATVGLLGLLPGLSLRTGPGQLLRGTGLGGRRSARTLRGALVFVEIVTAVVLVFGAGLMLETLAGLVRVDPGFESTRTASFSLAMAHGTEDEMAVAFYRRVLQAVSQIPGVEAAGAVNFVPLAGSGAGTSFYPVDRPEPAPGDRPVASIFVIQGRTLDALGVPVLEGRAFDQRDRALGEDTGKAGVVLVNRTLADELWPESTAVGRELFVNWGEAGARRIVGVVGDLRDRGIDLPSRPTIYFPNAQETTSALSVIFRTSGDFSSALSSVPSVIAEIDPTVPVYDRRHLDELVERSTASERMLASTLGGFASLALLLACLGIYGVSSSTVLARRREIGLRVALGATPSRILTTVLGSSLLLVVAGTAVGAVLAVLLARSLRSLLFGVEPADPLSLAVTAGILMLCALVAVMAPAKRVTAISPTEALRAN